MILAGGDIVGMLAVVRSFSCAAGRCLGAGSYALTDGTFRAMTVTESNGRFARASEVIAVPRGAGLHPRTFFTSIACVRAGVCVAAGYATNGRGGLAAMSAVRAAGRSTAAFVRPPANAVLGSHELSELNWVACTGTGHCITVGFYADASGAFETDFASTG